MSVREPDTPRREVAASLLPTADNARRVPDILERSRSCLADNLKPGLTRLLKVNGMRLGAFEIVGEARPCLGQSLKVRSESLRRDGRHPQTVLSLIATFLWGSHAELTARPLRGSARRSPGDAGGPTLGAQASAFRIPAKAFAGADPSLQVPSRYWEPRRALLFVCDGRQEPSSQSQSRDHGS